MPDPVVTTVVSPTPIERSLTLQVTVAALGRLLINTSRRFVYPFAPALSRGLGVPLVSITSIIAVNQFTGILSPLFGPVSDRWGYRAMMMVGLGCMAAGMLAGGFLPYYSVVLLAFLLVGLGKGMFDPALQAYVGERIPYHKRGMVIGLIEISWAGAAFAGIPAMGYLIEQFGWRAPFFVLGGLALIVGAAIGVVIPTQRQKTHLPKRAANFWHAWQYLRRERAAVGMLAFGFLASIANDNLFVVYGAWLEQSFALGLVALGIATTVIGLAELLGEILTSLLSDKLGLKRAVLIGITLTTLSYVLLPLMAQTLVLALIGLFITFLCFEFMIVTTISLNTEILPQARATMLSSLFASVSLGRVIGALLGGPMWLWGGLLAVGFTSAVMSALALIFFVWGFRRWQAG